MKLPPEDISYQVKANVINTKYLCEPFNWSIGPIFDITMIITQANGLTVALLKNINTDIPMTQKDLTYLNLFISNKSNVIKFTRI